MEGFAAKADTLMVQAGRAAGETERGVLRRSGHGCHVRPLALLLAQMRRGADGVSRGEATRAADVREAPV